MLKRVSFAVLAAAIQMVPASASTYLSATITVFGGTTSFPFSSMPDAKYEFSPFTFTIGFNDENGDFIFNGAEVASNGLTAGLHVYEDAFGRTTEQTFIDFSSVLLDWDVQKINVGHSVTYEGSSLPSFNAYYYDSGYYTASSGDFFDFGQSIGRASASVSVNGAVVPLPAGLALLPAGLAALGLVGWRRRGAGRRRLPA
jgi:hypothetical protein